MNPLPAACVLLALAFSADARAAAPPAAEGRTLKQRSHFRMNGVRRSYLVHLPPGYDPARSWPLLIAFHGSFMTAGEMEHSTRLNAVADREGFLVAYPNGIGLFGRLQHWNAGHCCGKAARDRVDDVGFAVSVIEDVCRDFAVDRGRVYACGQSNGGMFVHRLAAERPELLAGAATVAGAIGSRMAPNPPAWVIPHPALPVPMVMLHGRQDTRVPYEGGRSPKKGGARRYRSAAEAVDFWAGADGATNDAQTVRLCGERVLRESRAAPGLGKVVVLYTIEDWDHDWPGAAYTARLPPDNPLRTFDAGAVCWEFLRDFRRLPDGRIERIPAAARNSP